MSDIMKPKDHGWAAGASAGYVAIHNEQPDEVYLIGHDLHSTNTKINNLYKSTKHYTTQEAGPTPAVNWITQWKTLAEWNPKITIIFSIDFDEGYLWIPLCKCFPLCNPVHGRRRTRLLCGIMFGTLI
jgi:hypothetical protein